MVRQVVSLMFSLLINVEAPTETANAGECLPAFKGQCQDTYSVPSESMMPTLLVGDQIKGDVSWYITHRPEPGDVVVFLFPTDIKIRYTKRVIGLPWGHNSNR